MQELISEHLYLTVAERSPQLRDELRASTGQPQRDVRPRPTGAWQGVEKVATGSGGCLVLCAGSKQAARHE